MLMGFGIPTASALDNGRIDQQLLKLDPKTRLEQTCDTEVMFAINRSENAYNVDKVIAYTFEDTIMGKNQIKAPGAAFRSRGKWSRSLIAARPDRDTSTRARSITRSALKFRAINGVTTIFTTEPTNEQAMLRGAPAPLAAPETTITPLPDNQHLGLS